VWQAAATTKLPVLGTRGVTSGADALEMMTAGATAVGVGSVLFRDPTAPERILREMQDWCGKHSIGRIADLTGSVIPYR